MSASMLISVIANNGDEAVIRANLVSGELALVTIEPGSVQIDPKIHPEAVTLSSDKARELAKALTSVADAMDFVRTNKFGLP
jgi:hypothetical protein